MVTQLTSSHNSPYQTLARKRADCTIAMHASKSASTDGATAVLPSGSTGIVSV